MKFKIYFTEYDNDVIELSETITSEITEHHS